MAGRNARPLWCVWVSRSCGHALIRISADSCMLVDRDGVRADPVSAPRIIGATTGNAAGTIPVIARAEREAFHYAAAWHGRRAFGHAPVRNRPAAPPS